MLLRLFIENVVLIKSLSLDFSKGLTVLTGETGAGKSILMDALSLALGERSDTSLIRKGSDMLSVSAAFEVSDTHPVRAFLSEKGFYSFDVLTLRRTVSKTGVSRAFLNDHCVTAGFLKETASYLAEIYSQFAVQELFSPSRHLFMLDTFGGLMSDVSNVQSLFRAHQALSKEIDDKRLQLEQAQRQESYLSFAVQELDAFDLKSGEEEELSKLRQTLQHDKQIKEALSFALHALSFDGVSKAERTLEKAQQYAPDTITPILDILSSARLNMDEAGALLSDALSASSDAGSLEKIDERFFALKDLYRKYRVSSEEELIAYLAQARSELSSLLKNEDEIKALVLKQQRVFEDYQTSAFALREKRQAAADRLEQGVMTLFPQLKMDKARFKVQMTEIPPSASGMDGVQFLVSMNAGTAFGAVHKIASGGELSRLILALKVNLSSINPYSLIVFDEIDAGIGGAVSSAVGALLRRLSFDRQVMVITHAPQITAYSNHHFKVAKEQNDGVHVTDVSTLSERERTEELARMLAGENITAEARAAAKALMDEAGKI